MAKKKIYHTSLKAVCSGAHADQIYLAGVQHQMPDPIADQVSYVLDARLGSERMNLTPLFNGGALIKDHYSGFNCIVRDSAGTLFVGEDDGIVRHQNGESHVFKLTKSIKLQGLVNCAYVRGIDDVVFGSSKGTLIHLKEGKFSLIKVPRTSADASVDQIHGIGADFMVGVGSQGHVVCFRGGEWGKIKAPVNSQLEAVWCKSKTEIYVGGWFGRAWCWDGDGRWTPLQTDFSGEERDFNFRGFAEYQGILYAACSANGLYRLDGARFIPIPKVANAYVSSLTVTNIGLIGLGGVWGESGSWLTRFDGTNWTAEQIHIKGFRAQTGGICPIR